MATNKRFSGDYNITSVDDTGNVVIDVNTVEILGNLNVEGNLTYINVTELNVTDPFILVNASNTGSYSANSGVLTHVTSNTFAGIRYSNSAGAWEVNVGTSDATGETGTWTTLTAAGAIGGANTQVQFNDSGVFGASANLVWDKAYNHLETAGSIKITNLPYVPSSWPSSTVLYSNTPGSGGTGLYFTTVAADDELISRTKAIVFSIIF